ncbi:Autoinducer 2 (AI-2) modifying protein LsrG [Klebsiella pneumoniae]|uniref:Autoinducer 2 (AI-2) modifying protein LsrG n=1 Tax=Klebsiella pneumoniae TaxID=573 RepID=A0A2X3FB96_KLEPN|nr:Autoinducer 2 (AI-2) modifying protein LsrG [Klebsiella pneumoniae]
MNVTLVEINIKPERVDDFSRCFAPTTRARCRSQATCALMSCRILR